MAQLTWKKANCTKLKRIVELAEQARDAAAEATKAKVEDLKHLVNVATSAQANHEAFKERILECLGKRKI